MASDIILIGPQGAGKSTIGSLLSDRLGLPQCSMDTQRWGYYKEIGYDDAVAKKSVKLKELGASSNIGNPSRRTL